MIKPRLPQKCLKLDRMAFTITFEIYSKVKTTSYYLASPLFSLILKLYSSYWISNSV